MARRLASGLTGGGLLASAALAHHSVAGQYDPEQRIELSGVIRKVDWINPHTYLHLEVTDGGGSITSWRLESAPTAMLRKASITPAMLMGDGAVVTVDVILARDGTERLAWLYRIDYPDGHGYQLSGER
jgi:hypothetical protein